MFANQLLRHQLLSSILSYLSITKLMLSFIRFCFVTLLVLLQLVAPLIHAHKNEKVETASSFHLPEFEQVSALLDKDASVMIAPTFHEGEIVTISSGVKENQRRCLFANDSAIFIFSFIFFFVFNEVVLCLFIVKTEPIKKLHFFSSTHQRAPPFLHSF